MNIEKILEAADAIENHKIADLGFNMNYEYFNPGFDADQSGHNCGTVACILGWVNALDGRRGSGSATEATKTLGITECQADELFYPYDSISGFDSVTPAEAATTLRKLAETGEVDWSHADGYQP